MIADDLLQLMTAAIDGELAPPEAERLRVALAESPDARAVYAKLQADSRRIRALPRVAPPADLHRRVMARVAAVTPRPARTPKTEPTQPLAEPAGPATVPFRQRVRPWVPVGIAAGLLLAITGGSFAFFSQDDTDLARNPNRPPPSTRVGADDPRWTKWLPADGSPPPSAPLPREQLGGGGDVVIDDRPPTPPVPPVVPPDAVVIAPDPRPVRPDLHTSPFFPTPKFDLVEVRIPFLRSLSDFDREDTRQMFAEELARDPAFRIDLFTRDSARAAAVLRESAKAAGLNVVADATTADRLGKRQVTSVVVYTKSLMPDELAAFFGRLCADDAKISPRVFDAVHVVPVTAADQRELKNVLGQDPGLYKRTVNEKPEQRERPGANGKPISDGTADEIVKSLTAGQPAGQGKAPEKHAVMLTWDPITARTNPVLSAELKSFLAKRGDRKPNAVPVIIVIRPGNG